MPDFDFDAFNHDTPYEGEDGQNNQPAGAYTAPAAEETPVADTTEEPAAAASETPASDIADDETTTNETNNGPVDNGSSEVAEKW
jgi:hypothetical protein